MTTKFLKKNNFEWIDEYGSFKLKGIDTHGGRKKTKAITFTSSMTFEVEEGEIIEEDRGQLSSTIKDRKEKVKLCQHSECSEPAARSRNKENLDLVWCRSHLDEFRQKSISIKKFETLLSRTADNIEASIDLMEKIIEFRKEITGKFYKELDVGHTCRINYLIHKRNLYIESLKDRRIQPVLFSEEDYLQYKIYAFIPTKAFVEKQNLSYDGLLKSFIHALKQ